MVQSEDSTPHYLRPFHYDIEVAYDGTSFWGWQKTEAGPSIHQAIEEAFVQFMHQVPEIEVASRTDRGVHAYGQRFGVRLPHPLTPSTFRYKTAELVWKLNALLPAEIRVRQVTEPDPKWHPSLTVVKKRYLYYFHTEPLFPPYRSFSWLVPYFPQAERIQEVIPLLVGTHDFAFLCNDRSRCHYDSTVRTIESITWTLEKPALYRLEVVGNHFLYKMVRNIAGLCAWVAQDKISIESIQKVISSGKRGFLFPTAPAHGLVLDQLFY